MNIVIVESPAKAKTIEKYLGGDFKVIASMGHVRDLPPKDGSVDTDNNFKMSWITDSKSQKLLNEIAAAVKGADRLILATDPDREGEAISWHVKEVLERKKALVNKKVQRVVFNAITKNSVLAAMENPRDLDEHLIDAYRARRALDYLVGFTLSPVLWRKLPGARSAGRVQSVALRLICDREREVENFKPVEYWSVLANLSNQEGHKFQARVVEFDGAKLGKHDIPNAEQANEIKGFLEQGAFQVSSVESKMQNRRPAAPFTTSTLQQEASRKLGFSASVTMRVAQKLYEGVNVDGETTGLITYMRTDGVQIASEALTETRNVIEREFGGRYLPEKAIMYSSKAKNAQEAHEAIRPTSLFRLPDHVARILDKDQLRLYELIWKRTVASQMEAAQIERTTVDIDVAGNGHSAKVRATGSVIRFDGFLKLYQEGKDDEEDEENRRLPALNNNEKLQRESVEANQHFTEPPPRYNEASLVKKLEELGIGRPSTYASTLKTLQDREYVTMEKKRLLPADKGRIVTSFLESFFQRYVEFDFTANLEEKLDLISADKLDWMEVMAEFWREFTGAVDSVKDVSVSDVIDTLNETLSHLVFPPRDDGGNPQMCPKCGDGNLSLKLSKTGAFVGCSKYPDCKYTRQLGNTIDNGAAELGEDGQKLLGQDDNGVDITLRTGRFGPYVQLGEGEKPKRVSLPRDWSLGGMDIDKAKMLLSLPREIGFPPGSEHPILAGIGRYGPYVVQNGVYANLNSTEEVFTVGINMAVDLLANKKSKGSSGWRTSSVMKELGDHPDGGKITLRNGRYGPYVNHGKINATLPRNIEPESVTFEQAVEMIANKAANPSRKRPPKKSGKRK